MNNNNVVHFPQKNLYIVDDYYVILATSPEEALVTADYRDQEYEGIFDERRSSEPFSIELIDEQKELYVIKSGKVEVMLWNREPKELERVSFRIKVRDFINTYLKSASTPSSIDILEDKGAIQLKY